MHEATPLTPWLPEGHVEVERVEEQVVADGLILGRAGVCVKTPSGEVVTGSAAGRGPAPMGRARYEAWERAAVIEAMSSGRDVLTLRDRAGEAIGLVPRSAVFPESDAPQAWRHARSNGVALHDDWARACDRAWWELCERDRVLRAWLGETVPSLLPARRAGAAEAPWAGSSSYDWQVARFGEADAVLAGVEVVGVFGFPKPASAPMVVGYGARPSLDAAIEAAAGEAFQNLAFLWGEEIPARWPPVGPTPLHHLEHLLWPGSHPVTRAWLAGGHDAHFDGAARPPLRRPGGFVDLTPAWLEGRGRVCRAIADDAVTLTFGADPAFGHLPHELRVHPIP